MKITEKTSSTLMVAHVFATIMIIAIHYNRKVVYNANGDIWNWNYLIQEILANGLARCAVPYFALISGFFLFSQYSENRSYLKLLGSKFRTLFTPYVLGAAAIYFFIAAAKLPKGDTSFFAVKAAFPGIFITPLAGQFWFLRDLCFLVVISPLLFPTGLFLRYFMGIVLFLSWALELQIAPTLGNWYVVNTETLFFFYLGGQVSLNSGILDRVANAKATSIAATSLVLTIVLAARIILDPTIDLWYNTSRGYGLVPLLLYKAAILVGMVNLIQIAALFRNHPRLIYLSGLTFFAFLFHLTPLSIALSRFADLFMAREFSFYVTFPLATVIVFYLACLIYERAPGFYGILCGSRTPRKSLSRNHTRDTDPFSSGLPEEPGNRQGR